MDEKTAGKAHKLLLNNRNTGSFTGILDVLSFDIAEILLCRAGRPLSAGDTLRDMARATIRMVSESVDAYVRQDVDLAQQVIAADDEVDGYFDRIKAHLIDRIAKDVDDGEATLDLLMIAKYYERIGDHATNIAEWVMFSVTGVHKTEAT